MVRNRSDIIDFLSSHKEEPQQRFGATSIGLFGSYARAETKVAPIQTAPSTCARSISRCAR